jgi:hypothetical protein
VQGLVAFFAGDPFLPKDVHEKPTRCLELDPRKLPVLSKPCLAPRSPAGRLALPLRKIGWSYEAGCRQGGAAVWHLAMSRWLPANSPASSSSLWRLQPQCAPPAPAHPAESLPAWSAWLCCQQWMVFGGVVAPAGVTSWASKQASSSQLQQILSPCRLTLSGAVRLDRTRNT